MVCRIVEVGEVGLRICDWVVSLAFLPASISSSKEWVESGGDGRPPISRGVGSSTGRGTGGFVTDIVGRFGGDFRDSFEAFCESSLSPCDDDGCSSEPDTSAKTGMATSAAA